MFEKIKKYFGWCFFLLVAVALLVFANVLQSRGVQTSTDATVESIDQSAAGAGASIAAGQREIEAAQDSISGASATVDRIGETVSAGKQSAAEISDGISQCSGLVERGIELNRTAQSIVSAIEEGHSQGTSTSQERKN